ncbi:hypothetical protein [Cupriavidus pinatubonensis]|uniref:Uncharacterized protein n=1 Tax=Cupriavidus pinatubonensis TaxID=248026 RepID=A0ABN7ZNS1_9BURK|nr:hypothetical protein [Cupriavidus pinatubonensis]CAG9187599.1 hypothetical protein LMG23994_07044 [Cupriavidus pinatubonensis]
MIGGIAETQEMLAFCARRGILPDCEMIRMDQINEAFERVEHADVRYRFVIDTASLPQPPPWQAIADSKLAVRIFSTIVGRNLC